jgi:hypothetical protein
MKKINYIETEEKLDGSGHGFEFHYLPLTYDDLGFHHPDQEPVAILLLDGWYNNLSKSIHVRIHPSTSPILKGMDEKPELIIAEVKEAIELILNNKTQRIPLPKGQITDHVWIWVNA